MALTSPPDFVDGILTAAKLQQISDAVSDRSVLTAYKTADETINSSTTLQNDNELVLAVEAGAVYEGHLLAIVNGVAAGDFKCAFSLPSGATMVAWRFNFGLTGAIAQGFCLAGAAISGLDTTGADQPLELRGLLIMSSTAGNAQWQWAQNTSNAGNTTVETNSLFTLRRIT